MDLRDNRIWYAGAGTVGAMVSGKPLAEQMKNVNASYDDELSGLAIFALGAYMVTMKGRTATYVGLGLASTGLAYAGMSFANKQGLGSMLNTGTGQNALDEKNDDLTGGTIV